MKSKSSRRPGSSSSPPPAVEEKPSLAPKRSRLAWTPSIHVVVLLLATVVVFSRCLGHDFVNWDDDILVTGNRALHEAGWRGLLLFFAQAPNAVYIPLTMCSYWVEYQCSALNPVVYHATNVWLHGVNVLLVYGLLYLAGRNLWGAFWGALFFALHPLRVETVAWVTGRKDVLYGAFYLSALMAWLVYLQSKRWRWWFVSLGFFFLSLLAKGAAVTLPIVLVLLDYHHGRSLNRRVLLEKVPFVLPALLLGVLSMVLTGQESSNPYALEWHERPLMAAYAFFLYLVKTLVPVGLSPLYGFPSEPSGMGLLFRWLAVVAAVLLVVLVSYWGRRSRLLVAGWLFYVLLIAPFTHLIPWSSHAPAADRFTYLPSVGLACMVVVGWSALVHSRLWSGLLFRRFAWLVGICLAVLLGALSYHQCGVWKNSESLWSEVLARDPMNRIALTNRGHFRLERGFTEAALGDYSRAIESAPRHADAWAARGNALVMAGRLEPAWRDFSRALELNPRHAGALLGRGTILARQKDYTRAEDHFTSAILANPSDASGYVNRGNVHSARGNLERARADYTKALALDPQNAQAHDNMGSLLVLMGNTALALDHFALALRADSGFVRAYLHRANLLAKLERHDEALADLTRVVELEPGMERAWMARAQLHALAGRGQEALGDLDQVLKLNPRNADALRLRAGISGSPAQSP